MRDGIFICQHLAHTPSGKCMGCGEQHQPLPNYQEGDDEPFLRDWFDTATKDNGGEHGD